MNSSENVPSISSKSNIELIPTIDFTNYSNPNFSNLSSLNMNSLNSERIKFLLLNIKTKISNN